MFIVGLELNTGRLREMASSVVAVSVTGLVVPFVGGAALALWLYPLLSSSNVQFTSFSLFLGVAMAITAFPVLARILGDRGWIRTGPGVTALGAAAVGDVVAWCLLALVVGVAKEQVGDALGVVLWAAMFVAGMILVVRPVVNRYVRTHGMGAPSPGVIAIVLVGVLLAALATEGIGIHAVFGAFLFGALIPHDSRLAKDIEKKLNDVVTVLLLPAFFAFTGLRTQVGLVSSGTDWAVCGVIVLVATLGKFVGATAAARFTGHGWRSAAAVGALMNTRGLMELIVLNIGLDLGVISPAIRDDGHHGLGDDRNDWAGCADFDAPRQGSGVVSGRTCRAGPAKRLPTLPIGILPPRADDVRYGRSTCSFVGSPRWPPASSSKLTPYQPDPGDDPSGTSPPFDLIRQLDSMAGKGTRSARR